MRRHWRAAAGCRTGREAAGPGGAAQARHGGAAPTFHPACLRGHPSRALQPRNGTSAVYDEHGRAALEAIDQGAQVVLGLGYICLLHWANLAEPRKLAQAPLT